MKTQIHYVRLTIIQQILIILYSKDINAQDIYIKGTVSDSTNQPLYGATISLIDKNNFVITYVFSGKDGGFKLPYFDNGVLINVSYIGYMSANLSIAITKKEYNIKLLNPAQKIIDYWKNLWGMPDKYQAQSIVDQIIIRWTHF